MTTNRTFAFPGFSYISLALVGLMWVLPFLQPRHFYPLPSFYSECLAFALGLAALSLLLQKRYWETTGLPKIALMPLGLCAVILLQLAFDKVAYPEQALLAMLYLLWSASLMLLGSVLGRQVGLVKISIVLSWFLLAGGEFSALAAILQHYQIYLGLPFDLKTSSAVYGNLAQPNHFADYMALSFASLLLLLASSRVTAAAAIPLTLPLLFVLALTGSRSAWLYLFALLILSVLFHWRQGSSQSRTLLVFVFALLPGFALVQWLANSPWFATSTPMVTSSQRLFELASGPSVRFYLWREAWLMFLHSPLLGAGFGQFPWQHFQHLGIFKDYDVSGIYNNAHDIVMQLLAETGLTGFTLVTAGVCTWLYMLKRSSTFDIHLWWLLALLAILGIHSLLEFPLWYSYFLGIASIMFGIGEARFLRLEHPRLGPTSFALMLFLGWASAISLFQSYRSMEQLLFPATPHEVNAKDNEQVNKGLLEIYRTSLLVPYVELAYTGAILLDAGDLNDKLALNSRVMHFAPVSPVVYRQAVLLALNGELGAAQQQFDHAILAYPEDLASFDKTLRSLVARYPEQLAPLLKLTDQKLKEQRSAVHTK